MTRRQQRVVDDETFQALVARELPGLLGLARSLTGSAPDADDLVQETLAQAIRQWDRVSASQHHGAYLRRMMTNAFISAGRRAWRREVVSHDLATDQRTASRSYDATPDGQRDEMLSMLRLLPRRQRAVLALRYYEDMTFADVARTLGCSENAARTAASRGLSALRDHLNAADTGSPARSCSP